jgi:inorganic pyrophosphatase
MISKLGVVIDRPRGDEHPRYRRWIYPLDYGFIRETVGGDGHEVDVFCGTAQTGLTAAFAVRHHDVEEIKLLWNTSPEEVRRAYDFLAGDMSVKIIWRGERPWS